MARLADPDVTPAERATIAGDLAGRAFAQLCPDADHADIGRQLIAAGLLIQAGVIDHGLLAETVRAAAGNQPLG